MPIIAEEAGGNFEKVAPGSYAAVCTRVLDLGLQPLGTYGDKRRVRIEWELDEKNKEGEPFTIMQSYTLSLSEKANLRKDLQSWRGRPFTAEELKGFDLENLLGKGCLLSVIHTETDGKTYANISSIGPLPKGMVAPKPVGELLVFSCDEPDMAVLDKLHEKLGDKITTGMHKLKDGTPQNRPIPAAQELEDEIPF